VTKPKDKQSLLADVEKLLGKEARDIADQVFDGIAELSVAFKEAKRVDRWWATFNASLGGLLGNSAQVGQDHVRNARYVADDVHGPLKDAK